MTEYKKVFVDTAPFIYLLERGIYYEKIQKLFADWYHKKTSIITSVITVEEYCVYPYKQNHLEFINNFDQFLLAFGIDIYPIDIEIAKKAAWIRSKYPAFKAMDSLQLAVAEINQCDCFLTNDKQLNQYTRVSSLIVGDL